MAKLTRESRLRERRFEKQARKDARKLAASDPDAHADHVAGSEFEGDPSAVPAAEQPAESN